jgi:hypothetical protein
MAAADTPSATQNPSLPFPLQDGERVLKVCRRHWIYFWPMMAAQFVAAVVPIILLALLLNAVDALDGTGSRIFFILSVAYLVYWGVRLVLTWYRYQHDIWVITNQRLIDSYRRHPFDMSISTADLVNIQDMTVERSGILRTMLDFGNVVCQTASSDQSFMLTGVPDPRETQALVDRERDRERMRLRGTQL